uniref:Uncharacterized protein n=1 Tax=viral metagenome TaxID=1070528 RepID=A0A6M3K1B9_9ZZZZ
MKKEKEVQVTKKEEVYYCDECGDVLVYNDNGSTPEFLIGDISLDLHEGECFDAFTNKILALRAEPKE